MLCARIFAATACTVLMLPIAAYAQPAGDTLPKRRAGLWEHVAESSARPGASVRSQQCVDAASDAEGLRRALAGDDRTSCSVRAVRPIGGGVELDMGCIGPDGATSTVTRLVGDMSNSYRIESQVRSAARPGQPARDSRLVVRANYAGACGSAVRPGEQRVVGAPGAELDEAKLQAMSPLERKRALDAAGRPEKQ